MRALWGEHDWTDAGDGDAAPDADSALVVDSFLLDDGRVRDLDRHRERFASSCETLNLATGDRLERFLDASSALLPGEGRWFPRLEAHEGDPAALVCWIRPAPPLTDSVRLWIYPDRDPRTVARIKGPDLAVLAGLRAQAVERGADDAVLSNPGGLVLEAAHSALLWWRDGMLCCPARDMPVLPSVTARRLLDFAVAAGLNIGHERCRWTELTELEVWAVNALHGIRPVTAWVDFDREITAPPVDTARLRRFQEQSSVPVSVRDLTSSPIERPDHLGDLCEPS